MRQSKVIISLFIAGIVIVTSGLGAAAEVKKPTGVTPVSPAKKKSNLSEAECEAAKGWIAKKSICASGLACAVKDEDAIWRYVCITKQ